MIINAIDNGMETTCAEQWKLLGRYFSLIVCSDGEIVMFVGGKWTLAKMINHDNDAGDD